MQSPPLSLRIRRRTKIFFATIGFILGIAGAAVTNGTAVYVTIKDIYFFFFPWTPNGIDKAKFMVGTWQSLSDARRVLTIDPSGNFLDSSVNTGNLIKLPIPGQDNAYDFAYQGQRKCPAQINPAAWNKINLNALGSHDSNCLSGLFQKTY